MFSSLCSCGWLGTCPQPLEPCTLQKNVQRNSEGSVHTCVCMCVLWEIMYKAHRELESTLNKDKVISRSLWSPWIFTCKLTPYIHKFLCKFPFSSTETCLSLEDIPFHSFTLPSLWLSLTVFKNPFYLPMPPTPPYHSDAPLLKCGGITPFLFVECKGSLMLQIQLVLQVVFPFSQLLTKASSTQAFLTWFLIWWLMMVSSRFSHKHLEVVFDFFPLLLSCQSPGYLPTCS